MSCSLLIRGGLLGLLRCAPALVALANYEIETLCLPTHSTGPPQMVGLPVGS